MQGTEENTPRGGIKNLQRYEQSKNIDYSRLVRRRNITPSDLDGSYDIDKRAFFWLEAKLIGTKMEYGQRTHLEALPEAIHYACKADSRFVGFAIVFEHNVPVGEIIYPENCIVSKIFDSETLTWHKPENPTTLKDQLDICEAIYDRKAEMYHKEMANANADKARKRYQQNIENA